MKKYALILILAIASLPCAPALAADKAEPASQKTRDGVFIHVTSGPESAHRVLMALKMATAMSENGAKDVLLYFDIEGIKVLLKDAPDIEHKGFEGSKKQIALLLKRGVPIFACPGCLKAFDKTPEDLMTGVQVANRDAFFSFTKGRILTLDY
jgi:predicted peroxiredoxin